METKINIAEILKDKLENTKLYSTLFGDVYFYYVGNDLIKVKHHGGRIAILFDNGRYYNYPESELSLFPSKEMRDWSKFAWKKGDVLINSCGFQCIFKEWASDDYTKFNGCYSCSRDGYEDVSNAETAKFAKLDHNIAYGYVREIERKLGGKLNRETLEIEKTQPEFKDGDFITIKLPRGSSLICVFKAENDENYYLHASLDSRGMITINENSYCSKSGCIVRLSTEEEKTAFFDALARKGKIWDVEKKKIIALKQKWTPKPFDRVITRNDDDDIWTANIFSHIDSHGEYVTIGCVGGYTYCIPYNEETAKLIGTTKDMEV